MELDTLIEVSPAETRVAGVDQDGVLQSLEIERVSRASIVGAVVRGRISRVEKAMRAAFVDLGPLGEGLLPKGKDASGKPVTEGQWILVQVSRDATGDKGPAVTARITLHDRYLSYSPFGDRVEYDRRIGQGRERAELETAFGELGVTEKGGWTLRHPILAVDVGVLEQSAAMLSARWETIQTANTGDKTVPLEMAPSAWERAVRDAPPEGRVATDDRLLYGEIETLAKTRYPDLSQELMYHGGSDTLFETSGVEEQIDEALGRYVSLYSGGNLVFDETEAMTVVDVNLAEGAAALKGADAAVRLNIRAAEAVGRQIRLRNLSGLIVIDFIKMQRRAEGKRVVEALRRAVKGPSGTADVLGMTSAGLVEITRQRSGPSLSGLMHKPVTIERPLLPEVEAGRLLRDALRLRGGGRPVLTAPGAVLGILKASLADALAATEARLGQSVELVQDDKSRPQVRMEVRS